LIGPIVIAAAAPVVVPVGLRLRIAAIPRLLTLRRRGVPGLRALTVPFVIISRRLSMRDISRGTGIRRQLISLKGGHNLLHSSLVIFSVVEDLTTWMSVCLMSERALFRS